MNSIVFLTFLSCTSGSEKEKENPDLGSLEYKIQKSIAGVVDAFSYYPEQPLADAYKEYFISTIEESNIKLHYARANRYSEYDIVTIINADNQIYSIPFFPNKIANYWRFEFQEPDAKLPACHTTFEKEFLTAMDSLKLNDIQHTDSVVFNEIMLTVFNCKQLNENDSLKLRLNVPPIFSIKNDCKLLLNRSYHTILKGIYADKEHIYSGIFEDRYVFRIFWIDYGKKEETNSQQQERLKISIKVYGTNCLHDIDYIIM